MYETLAFLGWFSADYHARSFTEGDWEDCVRSLMRIGRGIKVSRARKQNLRVCKVPSDLYELMVRDAPSGWARTGSAVICLYTSIDDDRTSPQDVLFWTQWPLPSMCVRDPVLQTVHEHAIPMKRTNFIQLAYWGEIPDPWTGEHEQQLLVELQDWTLVKAQN